MLKRAQVVFRKRSRKSLATFGSVNSTTVPLASLNERMSSAFALPCSESLAPMIRLRPRQWDDRRSREVTRDQRAKDCKEDEGREKLHRRGIGKDCDLIAADRHCRLIPANSASDQGQPRR